MGEATLTVAAASAPALTGDAEVLVLLEPEGDALSRQAAVLDERLGGRLARARQFKDLTGRPNEVTLLHTDATIASPRVLVVGVGREDALTIERVRRAAGTAVRQLRRREVARASLVLPERLGDDSASWMPRAAAEGATVGDMEVGLYKRDRRARGPLAIEIARLEEAAPTGWEAEIARGRTIGEGINVARSLAIEPGNRMTPTILAERSRDIARQVGLHCEIIDTDRLFHLGAGALLGVARGSDEPPCLIVLRYLSPVPTTTTLAVVGKGVTFDSGGISIKAAQNMHEMKYDMCGAAAALGAMHAIARLAPSINVLGIVPATENLLSGRAMKPGDILRAMNGTSIEILNTDAEGRLILADAIVHAQNLGATHIVDAATLTGACVVALGEHASGLFAAPEEWLDTVRQAATRAGERVWPLPLFPEYREQLKSDVADIANVGGRSAGACTAAAFIREFVRPDVPWAHLDIAGTSHTSADRPYQAAGPTGAATRLFIELAMSLGPGAPA